ncbi:hypothetical protein SISNIDRAFT_490557 [Sistotremastrum niveocremeum HHB9708]|uniref:DNA replication regulator Sld3 C-terminal domain-containing protein n=1 Tax=Sistotremastrum niveocremeum HHB9708 TaxID=1314777 RepID=A0A164NU43_9AGAM|nr:hypothetical protein SISNIDRAFT_490557 [Sistotremastrum niveocremeum HHB9708]
MNGDGDGDSAFCPPYSMDSDCPVEWTASQQAAISSDYPLGAFNDNASNFVIKRYLETLWLPESIMSLNALVQSLRLIPNSSLQSMILPLLKTSRQTQDKFHRDLSSILENGEGGGDIEESMMWFVWGHEKYAEAEGESADHELKWRKAWLEKLEKRETQIQILLHMLYIVAPPSPALALTSTSPSKSSHSSPSKRKAGRKIHEAEDPAPPTYEEQLEHLMDKLAVWSLLSHIETQTTRPTATSERDWMQIFCEDVVEKLFIDDLPDQCALLRTKVFPSSSIPDSPPTPPFSRAFSRVPSRGPSVPRAFSREPSQPPLPNGRSRSRSGSTASVADPSYRPIGRVPSRTGVSTNKNPIEVPFRRSLSKPSLDFGKSNSGGSNAIPSASGRSSQNGDSIFNSARHRTESPPLPLFLPSNSPAASELPALGVKRKRAPSTSTVLAANATLNTNAGPTTLVFETPIKSRANEGNASRKMSFSSMDSMDDEESPDRLLLGTGGDSPSPAQSRLKGVLSFKPDIPSRSHVLVEDTPVKTGKR